MKSKTNGIVILVINEIGKIKITSEKDSMMRDLWKKSGFCLILWLSLWDINWYDEKRVNQVVSSEDWAEGVEDVSWQVPQY